MKKMSLLLALMVLLIGIPAHAQKKVKIGPADPPIVPMTIVVQDDSGEGFMAFDLATGDYKCYLCEYDYTLGGRGQVKINGCDVYFTVLDQKNYKVFASVNLCTQKANCVVEVYWNDDPTWNFARENWYEHFYDANLRDSKLECMAEIKQ